MENLYYFLLLFTHIAAFSAGMLIIYLNYEHYHSFVQGMLIMFKLNKQGKIQKEFEDKVKESEAELKKSSAAQDAETNTFRQQHTTVNARSAKD